MNRYISIEKRNKKEQKAYYSSRRILWGINPVTRIVPNGKRYRRQREKTALKKDTINTMVASFGGYNILVEEMSGRSTHPPMHFICAICTIKSLVFL